MTRPNQGLSLSLLGAGSERDPGNEVASKAPKKSQLRQLPTCNTIAKKLQKNTGKEVKTTMQKLWLNSFGIQLFVLH